MVLRMILKFFDEHPDQYFSVEELSKKLGLSKKSIYLKIKKLREREEINWIRKHDVKGINGYFCYCKKWE